MLYFVAASASVWLAVLGYVVRLGRKQVQLERLSQHELNFELVCPLEERP